MTAAAAGLEESPGALKPTLCPAHAGLRASMRDFATHLQAWRSHVSAAAAAVAVVHQQAGAIQANTQPAAPGKALRKVALQAPSAGLSLYMDRANAECDAHALSASLASLARRLEQAPGTLAAMHAIADNAQQYMESSPCCRSCEPACGTPLDLEDAQMAPSEPGYGHREGTPDCYARDAALLMATVMDMVQRDFDMQVAAWGDTRLETDVEHLHTYSRLCGMQPFLDDGLAAEVERWMETAPE
mmetsp:Transcript_21866/g.56949  ORF Transcript_21866/g.56949 Transcript_21866/m.56949 type:complete len:244 (+) Transcript_21866:343-1074(+)